MNSNSYFFYFDLNPTFLYLGIQTVRCDGIFKMPKNILARPEKAFA